MASTIPVAVSNLKRLIWNTRKAWFSKKKFHTFIQNIPVSKHSITSNLLLLKKPLSLQSFTLSLFLRLPLTESVSSSPLTSNVSHETREREGEREKGRERVAVPIWQKASFHCWIFTKFAMPKLLWLRSCKRTSKSLTLIYERKRARNEVSNGPHPSN